MLALAAAVLTLGCGAAAAKHVKRSEPGVVVHRHIVTGGKTRDYYFYRPVGVASTTPAALEVVLPAHGWSSFDPSTFNRVATDNGVLVAYPISEAGWGENGDERFVGDVIDELLRTEHADSRRVYVVGGSAGGFEAYTVACGAEGSKIAGVGAIFGGITTTSTSATVGQVCHPQGTISVFSIHGTDDGFVPYNGECHVGKEHGNTICVISQPKTMAFWAEHNGCRSAPSVSSGPNHKVETWLGCNGNAGVQLVTVSHGGHTYESLQVDGVEPATALIKFLLAHPRPLTGAAPKVQAQLVRVSVVRRADGVRVLTRLTLAEDLRAQLSVRQGRRVLKSTNASLRAGTASMSLVLPRRTAKGTYTLWLVLSDAAGNRRAITRRITIPHV